MGGFLMIKKGLIKKLMFSSFLALLCLTPVKAFADDFSSNGYIDNSIDITTFENEATTADKEYVKLRNSLVSKYGYKKAYVMLGSVPVEKKVIPIDSNSVNSTSSYLPMAVDPVIDSRVSVPGQVTGKGNLVITIYKNLTSNYMDIWYEMNYTTDTSGVGAKTKGDVMASSFATSNVYKVSTSYSGVIEDYVPYSCGGTGTIKGGSNYARMVFMVKPR